MQLGAREDATPFNPKALHQAPRSFRFQRSHLHGVRPTRCVQQPHAAQARALAVAPSLQHHDPRSRSARVGHMPWPGVSLYDFMKSNRFKPFQIEEVRHFSVQLLTAVECEPAASAATAARSVHVWNWRQRVASVCVATKGIVAVLPIYTCIVPVGTDCLSSLSGVCCAIQLFMRTN